MDIHEAHARRLMHDIYVVEFPKEHEWYITLYSTSGLIKVWTQCRLGVEVERIILRDFERRFETKPKIFYRKDVETRKQWDDIRNTWIVRV